MPKATQQATRPAAAPLSPISIADLGRHLAATEKASDRLDSEMMTSAGPKRRRYQAADLLLNYREAALRDLILTMPAETIADAAVQISAAYLAAENLEGNEHTEFEANRLTGQLVSTLLGILPIVAEAAGLNIEEMNWTALMELRRSRFDLAGVAA